MTGQADDKTKALREIALDWARRAKAAECEGEIKRMERMRRPAVKGNRKQRRAAAATIRKGKK